ncbi:diiron oxygenase [Actinomadura formosensis]|uniref:diiron oxygenase n=1 Tax=Actinomadura formosensis TaxID=60706 RepID=UPI0039089F41
MLPFGDHPAYQDLDQAKKHELLSWTIIAFNRNTVVAELTVANPAFELVISGEYPGLAGRALEACLLQAMVDEQYHTLMHINASAVTRRKRDRAIPDSALPLPHHSVRHQEMCAQAMERWQASLTTLAFSTDSEIGIGAYLDLLADNPNVQPIDQATAALHNRDEYCHASIAADARCARTSLLGLTGLTGLADPAPLTPDTPVRLATRFAKGMMPRHFAGLPGAAILPTRTTSSPD